MRPVQGQCSINYFQIIAKMSSYLHFLDRIIPGNVQSRTEETATVKFLLHPVDCNNVVM